MSFGIRIRNRIKWLNLLSTFAWLPHYLLTSLNDKDQILFINAHYTNNIMETNLNKKPFVVVDLNSGRYIIDQMGHELYNLQKNKVDNKYYGYCPPYDGINIQKLGAGQGAESINDIMIIYVTKTSDSNDRQIIAFCDRARAYKKGQHNPTLKRKIKMDGKMGDCSYSIESNYIYDLRNYPNKFFINIKEYNSWMFRAQKFYKHTYPELDKKILQYLESYLNPLEVLDDDDAKFQDRIQQEDTLKAKVYANDSTIEPVYSEGIIGRQVAKKSRISKAALIEAEFKCTGNEKHTTFITKKGDVYMEGHHMIPCTSSNSDFFWNNYGVNIDCVENIICLCPNCHRLIHLGSKETRRELLEKIYNHQILKINTLGIDISLNELIKLYEK